MKRRDLIGILCALHILAAAHTSCSPVKNLYVKNSYDPDAPGGVKKIRLFIRRHEGAPEITLLITAIARDHMKYRKNYNIRDAGIAESPSHEECGGIDGIIVFTILNGLRKGDGTSLRLKGELLRCPSREILWSGETNGSGLVPDDDVTGLVSIYRRDFGETALTFAASGFLQIRELLDTMPEPFSGMGLKNKVP